ncbi:hypothetical protein OB955_03160 [Halobacteria archaeon AArc-m2/3/4]|uniref:Uncharacterized protein n=1 Tax=Natronoglomus mannanivorans TaxID=2979990 RepID=A0AAP2YWB0_9EURY|nr:hypothetical protein [Halobacteria archaeon AArc-xg1-1]MCU4971736.1 hypothetical protein [Halobacteria archaeon AArc-m2/3/4]
MDDETPNTPDERQMTTDRDRIRSWVEKRDAVPAARHEGGAESTTGEHTFVHRDDVGDEYEERSWDEFFETFESDDMVFIYHDEASTTDLESFELAERDAVMDRAALENDQVEEALRTGETVTTELVETRVVEREIVETETIESEVVDTEILEREIVSSELLDREVIDVAFVDDDTLEVIVDETRTDTIEEIEQLTVESKIVDVDVDIEEHEESSTDEFEASVADETIHQAILESDVVRATTDTDEMLGQGRIRTDREGETIESRLIERQTVEEEIRDRREMMYTLEESEIVETEVFGSTVLDAELVDIEEYGDVSGAGMGVGTGEETAGTADAGGHSGGRTSGAGAEAGAGTDSGLDTEAAAQTDAGSEPDADHPTATIELTDDDQGKDVVDAMGEQVGIVADVEADTVYIDPEPGFTDRLKARFGWGEPDQDAYPVNSSQIKEVTDDEVVLEGE